MIVETGGLNPVTLADIWQLQLAGLDHLELWLRNADYGFKSSVEDLMPLLSGELFPNLKYLGLCDSEYADEVAKAVVNSPIIEPIKVLDLQLRTLGDEGAEV